MNQLVNIGFGNIVNFEKVISIINPDSAPAKRLVQSAKEEERIIDGTQGRKTKSIIILETNHIILSALQPDTLSGRFYGEAVHGIRNTAKELKKMMNNNGILVVISGFSGAGKGTVVKQLMNIYDNYALSVSATTRQPRAGEEEGVHYFFKTKEQFEEMITKDELIEYASYVNNYYGTPKKYVNEQLMAGKDVILEIELQGALKIKEKFPDTLLIFITPPSAVELKNRLVNRGTESAEVIEQRLARAYEESFYMDKYDMTIVNDDLEECVEQIHNTIQCEHAAAFRNRDFIKNISEDLKQFAKGE